MSHTSKQPEMPEDGERADASDPPSQTWLGVGGDPPPSCGFDEKAEAALRRKYSIPALAADVALRNIRGDDRLLTSLRNLLTMSAHVGIG